MVNIKLAGFVAVLGVGFYFFGTSALIPSVVLFIAFVLSPYSNQKNYMSSVAARSAKPNETAPYRKYADKLISAPKGVSTLYENFLNGRKISGGNGACLGTRVNGGEFVWETYDQVHDKIINFGSGLIDLGVEPGDRVGFYAKNRAEWFIGAESCNAYSFVSVAIYDTLGEENREFIVQQSGIRAVVTTNNLINYLVQLAPKCKELKIVVIMGNVSEEERKTGKDAGLSIYSFDEVIELGKNKPQETVPPKPDDLAILMYTSGTTSRPKGVMITNRNVVAVVAAVADAIPDTNKDDVYLSYLPLAHILERAAEAYIISRGGRIGFFQGDLRKLTDDIKQLKPTVYAGVPKVFQRIMNEVKKQIHDKGPVARVLFSLCYALKRKFRLVGLPTGIFDTIIFNKTKSGLGGNVKTIVSGGAPLPKECHEFLSICFGTTVQGYGLTETCGGATITPLDYPSPWERAGSPISCSEIKLVSSGKYSTATNPPQGELCVKGDNISLGYYQMEDKTAEVFVTEADGERWFHTGDVGRRNPDGSFSIVGRVKDIFKLDGGEYIAPERLESIYAQSKYISNIFVWGDSFKSHIVGIAVPEYTAATRWANENNVKYSDKVQAPNCPEELVNNADLKKVILADLKRIATEAKLNRYEEVPSIELDGLFWTPDTGLVTDALKNKRDPLYAKFKEQIDKMYANSNVQ